LARNRATRGTAEPRHADIDLTDDELAAPAALIPRAIEQDGFPLAPRLDPLRSVLAKLEPDKNANAQPSNPKRRPPGAPRT
jgi:hypothetical protein